VRLSAAAVAVEEHVIAELSNFHFLRPEWLLALPPAGMVLYLAWRGRGGEGGWRGVIDGALLPHLLEGRTESGRPAYWLPAMGLPIAILALAGPAWEKLPQPVQRREDALVILFDQSLSMLAEDIEPSRLVRARRKIVDLLDARREGTTGLIAYAGDAHVVSPLTDDDRTLVNLLPALEPGIMPLPGSEPARAVEAGIRLLRDAGLARGKLLLLTDGVRASDIEDIRRLLAGEAFTLLVLGVGTAQGRPIPTSEGYLKDRRGNIVIPALDRALLRELASAGGGRYRDISLDDSDLAALRSVSVPPGGEREWVAGRGADTWSDMGFWLLPLLVPLVLAGFRRGWLYVLLLLPCSEPARALEWSELWTNRDQQGARLLEQGRAAEAAERFRDPDWSAAAHYRARDYRRALEHYSRGDRADDWYNRGNALAHRGDFEAAVAAYDEALRREPAMEDAAFNKALLEQLLQQQQAARQDRPDRDGQDRSRQGQSQGQGQDQSGRRERGEEREPPGDRSERRQAENERRRPADTGRDPDERQTDLARQGASDGERRDGEPARRRDMRDPAERERELANEQWLRRIPDDPAGLLRRKFRYESQRRADQRDHRDEQTW